MLRGQPSQGGIRVHIDLAEAALDAGFALLRLAESQSDGRVLSEAEAACIEVERRLFGVMNSDARRLSRRLRQLRASIEDARGGRANRGARVIRVPAR